MVVRHNTTLESITYIYNRSKDHIKFQLMRLYEGWKKAQLDTIFVPKRKLQYTYDIMLKLSYMMKGKKYQPMVEEKMTRKYNSCRSSKQDSQFTI